MGPHLSPGEYLFCEHGREFCLNVIAFVTFAVEQWDQYLFFVSIFSDFLPLYGISIVAKQSEAFQLITNDFKGAVPTP